MFERLNEQTRQIVLDLIAGNKTKIGDEDVGPLDEDVQLVLQIVAEHLDGLKDLKGESLVDRFLTLFSSSQLSSATPISEFPFLFPLDIYLENMVAYMK